MSYKLNAGDKIGIALTAVITSAALLGIIGWGMNVAAVVHMAQADTYGGLFVLRCIGIPVAILGAILGYL